MRFPKVFIMKRAIGVAIMLASFSLPVSHARSQDPPDASHEIQRIFASFASSIEKLKDRLPQNSVALIHVNAIDNSVSLIKKQIDDHDLFPVPTYLQSLTLDAELLDDLASRPKPRTAAERTSALDDLESVAADLAVKVSHLQQHTKGPPLVEVTVRARNGNGEVEYYEIWYVPKGWATHPEAYKRFDQLTNRSLPPKMFLAPGNYFIWLNKPPVKTERSPVTIGGDGRARREIELLVP